eukprot:1284629-Alexandrium_andersonii.AAC.1
MSPGSRRVRTAFCSPASEPRHRRPCVQHFTPLRITVVIRLRSPLDSRASVFLRYSGLRAAHSPAGVNREVGAQ